MSDDDQPSGAARMFGDFSPRLVHFTDDVLFGGVWERPELAARDRSLITVASLSPAAAPNSCATIWAAPGTTASAKPN
ncbi:hypothetical protein [Streptomyces sp. NPDC095613]|uniref:carboxymuconolactone decarboxylase family protein n=1 Tax=Streptomyces sp. NPDC095613 TaxID=3155540 RepID=UPI0033215834